MPDVYDQQSLERIRNKIRIDQKTGCWEWQGHRSPDGYGQVKYHGAVHSVHRLTYRLLVGPIPDGMQLDHFACDNRACGNPEHVRPTTVRENVLRSGSIQSLNAAKTHCVNGHPFTPENTTRHPNGGRQCRACDQRRGREWRARRRASQSATSSPTPTRGERS